MIRAGGLFWKALYDLISSISFVVVIITCVEV